MEGTNWAGVIDQNWDAALAAMVRAGYDSAALDEDSVLTVEMGTDGAVSLRRDRVGTISPEAKAGEALILWTYCTGDRWHGGYDPDQYAKVGAEKDLWLRLHQTNGYRLPARPRPW